MPRHGNISRKYVSAREMASDLCDLYSSFPAFISVCVHQPLFFDLLSLAKHKTSTLRKCKRAYSQRSSEHRGEFLPVHATMRRRRLNPCLCSTGPSTSFKTPFVSCLRCAAPFLLFLPRFAWQRLLQRPPSERQRLLPEIPHSNPPLQLQAPRSSRAKTLASPPTRFAQRMTCRQPRLKFLLPWTSGTGSDAALTCPRSTTVA